MKLYPYLLIALSICLLPTATWSQCDITATSSGGNSSYTQVYVLVDASTGLIVAENTSGTFNSVAPGAYQVHALNYDPANPPSPLPSALIGQDISLVGSTITGCYNSDFLTDFVNRACTSCQQSNSICETDPLVVSSSGGNTGYTQLYVLVDASTGLITGTSNTGNFSGMVTAPNSYQIYALNYNPSDPPSPLPTIGQSVNNIGTVTQGCYNSDYLTDYVCYNVTFCNSPCFNSVSHCIGDDIIVSTSGHNTAYTQVFVLTDDSGNFIAENTTGVFNTSGLTSGATYRVHALNYNPSEAPSPLPSALNAGDPISGISGGCYNSDFLTDFLCFVMDCTLLSEDLLEFEGSAQNNANLLNWALVQTDDVESIELQRAQDGIDFESLADLTAAQNSFLDNDPYQVSYYRLFIHYRDGSKSVSNTIAISRNSPNRKDFQVFPNPSRGLFNIQFFSQQQAAASIKIYNMLGQLVKTAPLTVAAGNNQWSLDLSQLAAGNYILSIETAAWRVKQVVVKQ